MENGEVCTLVAWIKASQINLIVGVSLQIHIELTGLVNW
jgi:hypothetical protein